METIQNKELREINNPEEFFENLGLLHDSKAVKIEFLPIERSLMVYVNDINSNFLGLPEYKGLEPGILIFRGVFNWFVELEQYDPQLRIYEIASSRSSSGHEVEIKLSPSGLCNFACESIGIKS